MDRIQLLKTRREALKNAGKNIRSDIAALCDDESFVELAAFSYAKSDFFEEEAPGDGVITGFATIGGYPYYIIAQNFDVSFGGLSKTNCEKIVKALHAAEKSGTAVVYLLHSYGVRVGEGVHVLEGISELLLTASRLKGVVPQFAVVCGEAYGSVSALAALCDVVLFAEGAAMCPNSPFVLSARAGKNLKAEEVGGYRALSHAALPALHVGNMREAASAILAVSDLLRQDVLEAELNDPAPALNTAVSASALAKLIEGGVELGANSYPEIRTILGRLGGIAVAAAVFDGAKLNEGNLTKLTAFLRFASCFDLPFVCFADCTGIEAAREVADSAIYARIADYLAALDAVDVKLAAVTGKAVGLGYSLFAAKSAGFDYTVALATAETALFDSPEGAQIEFHGDPAKIAAFYAEEKADPIHASKGGYLDDIVEPQFLKQYLIAALQMLKS